MKIIEPKKVDKCSQTLNNYGLSFDILNEFGKKLIKMAEKDWPILDIGAGYGVFTIEALTKGFSVIANDLSKKHLEIIQEKASPSHRKKLSLYRGKFPDGVNIPPKSLGAVYACGVLHYLPPDVFIKALHKIHNCLKDNGLVCIVTTSPFLKGYKTFLPKYQEKLSNKELWPGYIENYNDFFTSDNFTNPESANIMDCTVLERALKDANFKTIALDYISIENDYKEQYDCGKELSAIIAMKQ